MADLPWKARLALPETAKRGESIEVRTLIAHPMESGFRLDQKGKAIPSDILVDFQCVYLDETVFRTTMFPAISANPYVSFYLRAERTGDVVVIWTDQSGQRVMERRHLKVEEA